MCQMFESGASVSDLERKFPLFSKEEIVYLLQEQYDVTKMDFSLIHGTFIKVYQRNIGRLNRIISDNLTEQPEVSLAAIALLTKTLEGATSYTKLVDTHFEKKLNPNEEDPLNVTISLQKRIEQRLNEIAPPLQTHFLTEVRRLVDSGATREDIAGFVEAEWHFEESELTTPQLQLPEAKLTATEELGINLEEDEE